jgi:hypothetical protein
VPGKIKRFLLKALWQDPNYEIDQVNCPEITIENIDSALYAKLLSGATSAGAQFDGAKASIRGADFDWNYDQSAQILHITCTRKPFYATCAEVESRIRSLVDEAKGAL